jgi:L-glutamine:2-deoxy-scyllo-inosose/3-amino-2,3-dideoxy-scyllo-inosose aminotransferase
MGKLAITGGEPTAQLSAPAWPVHNADDAQRLLRVLESGSWSMMGEMEDAFNRAWAEFSGSRYSLAVTNGTHALQLAYEALDIGFGDEVIVPAMTWQATAGAALDVNAVPVLVDVEADTWCIDPQAVESAITPRTRAIACVHLYGCMVDMDAIMDIARRHDLRVVEDCSHQHGSQWRGKGVGTTGDVGTFSFQLSKVMTAGECGCVFAQDDDLFRRLDQLRSCGRPSSHFPEKAQSPLQSGNFRVTEWQCAILLGQLKRLPDQIATREVCGQRLNRVLAESPGVSPLRRLDGVTRQSYYSYGFRFLSEEWDGLSRDRFCAALSAETGLEFAKPYSSLNDCDLYQPRTKRRHRISDEYWAAIDPTRFHVPVADRTSKAEGVVMDHQVLLLPPENMDAVGEAILKLHRHRDELRG